MKATIQIALALLLCSCQKEVSYLRQPEPAPIAQALSQPDLAPAQIISISQFAPMLWDKAYKISSCKNNRSLWDATPSWIKDDVYTFNESGKALINANSDQNPLIQFETIERDWKLYAENGTVKLDWINAQYEPTTYSIVSYKKEESFTLSAMINDSLELYTYTSMK